MTGGRVLVLAMVAAVAVGGCGPPAPPGVQPGAISGVVLVEGGAPLGSISGIASMDAGLVIAVPADRAANFLAASPDIHRAPSLAGGGLVPGPFRVPVDSVEQHGGALSLLSAEATFVVGADEDADGHLLCFSGSPLDDDAVTVDACELVDLSIPARIRLTIGDRFGVEPVP